MKNGAKMPQGMKRILWNAALLLVLTGVLCALYALLVINGVLGQETAAAAALVLLGASALFTAWLGSRRTKEKRLQSAMLSAAAVLLVLLIIHVLFLPSGMPGVLPVIAAIIGSTLLGCLAAGSRPHGAKRPVARRRR